MALIKANDDNIIITTADNVLLYNTTKNEDKALKIPEPKVPDNLTNGQRNVLLKEDRSITCLQFSRDGQYFAIGSENKQIVVFDMEANILKNVVVNRAPSQLCFTPGNDVIVADKTGDVYLIKLRENGPPELLLGHLSVILDVVMSECGKYIITCDRDEKIRVSCFPNAYNIVSYCLGHTEFVTAVRVHKDVLISASGDGTVRLWNYLEGKETHVINTNENVDEDVLRNFTNEMDSESVEISALPVTDVEVLANNTFIVAATVYKENKIRLYKCEFSGNVCTSALLHVIKLTDDFVFCLSKDLIILTSGAILVYSVIDNFKLLGSDDVFKRLLSVYKSKLSNKFHCDRDMNSLYKRKFDNVQEYLERKKIRLALK